MLQDHSQVTRHYQRRLGIPHIFLFRTNCPYYFAQIIDFKLFCKNLNTFEKVRFCSKLNLPKEVRLLANRIVNKASDISTLTGRSPNSLAAASIYLAAELTGNGGQRSAEEIGRICGAAENTIKTTIKLMQPQLKQLLPPDFVPVNGSTIASIKI